MQLKSAEGAATPLNKTKSAAIAITADAINSVFIVCSKKLVPVAGERRAPSRRGSSLRAEHACGVPANAAGSARWRVTYVLPDLMPPGDDIGSCRCRRSRDHGFQLDLHFRPPGRAFAGAGRPVDRALVDQHGLVAGESHGILFRYRWAGQRFLIARHDSFGLG